MKKLLAIDPGALGGWAWSADGETVETMKFPATQGDVVTALRSLYASHGVQTLVMEEVGGYAGGAGAPGSAMFNFGEGYGHIKGAAQMAGYKLVLVRPQKWQKHFGFGKKIKRTTAKGKTVTDNTEWKNRLRTRAQELFPHNDVILGTADALLIFEWAQYQNL